MPAAAVIPAPIAYIKVVAGKKLVVGFLSGEGGLHFVHVSTTVSASGSLSLLLHCNKRRLLFYFEEIRVFTAGFRLEYISME